MHHLKCVRCLRKLGMWGDLGILFGSNGNGMYLDTATNLHWEDIQLLMSSGDIFGSVWTRAHYSGGMMEPPPPPPPAPPKQSW